MLFNLLIIIVILNTVATIALWIFVRYGVVSVLANLQEAIADLKETTERLDRSPKEEFLDQLLHSEPITPKHTPPPPAKGAWWNTEQYQQFFNDFEHFADVINRSLATCPGPDPDDEPGSPWRLQELPDPETRLMWLGSPNYGRCYAIFHNQARIGRLEVWPFLYHHEADDDRVSMSIELEYVRLLPYDSVRIFLAEIAHHICTPRRGSEKYASSARQKNEDASQKIDGEIIEALWPATLVSEYEDYGRLKLHLSGSAGFYFDCRQGRTQT